MHSSINLDWRIISFFPFFSLFFSHPTWYVSIGCPSAIRTRTKLCCGSARSLRSDSERIALIKFHGKKRKPRFAELLSLVAGFFYLSYLPFNLRANEKELSWTDGKLKRRKSKADWDVKYWLQKYIRSVIKRKNKYVIYCHSRLSRIVRYFQK